MFKQIAFLSLLFTAHIVYCNADTTISTKTLTKSVEYNRSNDSINDNDFLSFWKTFRAAVISYDSNTIISLTKFPFKTKGTLDSDPTMQLNKSNFFKTFKKFLNQWTGFDVSNDTELDFIKKNEKPKKEDIQKDYARVGDMVFMRINGQWNFTSLYLNTEQ